MKNFNYIIVFFVFLFVGCNQSTNQSKLDNNIQKDTLDIEKEDFDNKIQKDTSNSIEKENEVPPFKNRCLCKFNEFGYYKISDNNYNVYFSGKNWNPDLNDCAFIWGEIVNNIVPDPSVTLLKIHLLDLNNFSIPSNLTEYGNDSIKKHVIAIYYYDQKSPGKSVFDPYKTGKYRKPKGWNEN